MPYKKYYKRRKPYSTYRRKRKGYSSYRKKRSPFNQPTYRSKPVGRITTGFPNRLKYRFKSISNNLAITPATTFSSYSFNVNSLPDPFGTGGSSRPYMYNQLSDLYNHYMVYSGVFRFTFVNQTPNPVRVGIVTRADNEAPTTMQELLMVKGAYVIDLTEAGGSRSRGYVQKSFKVSRWFGRNGLYSTLGATFDNEPAKRLYMFVAIESISHAGGANILGVAQIQAFQNTLLYDPEVQDPSAPALDLNKVTQLESKTESKDMSDAKLSPEVPTDIAKQSIDPTDSVFDDDDCDDKSDDETELDDDEIDALISKLKKSKVVK